MTKIKTTIHDIARVLNLTASTVSRALNDHPKISSSTKALVKKTAEEMGYKPNPVAATLRTGKGKTIGMIVPRINRDFVSNVIAGAENICRQGGYSLIICQSEENLIREKEAIATLLNSRVSGILISISAQTNTSDHLSSIIKEGIPIVQFDRIRTDISTNSVVNDNYAAAYEATLHLINQECKNIYFFSGQRYINIYKERCEGFIDAMKNLNKAVDEMIIEPVITQEKGYEITSQLLLSDTPPDAILAASDYSALGALLAAKDLSVNIPAKLAIIGFSNEPFTALITPSLTSIDQKAKEMGENAAKLLLEAVNHPHLQLPPQQIILKTELCIRQSSKKQEL
jgi:LacI family transcriptional regulator